MTWNYRILLRKGSTQYSGEYQYYAIHEVYYDENGGLSWSLEPAIVMGEEKEDFLGTLEKINYALKRTVLEVIDGDDVGTLKDTGKLLEDIESELE